MGVGPAVVVDGGRHGHDVDIAIGKIGNVARKAQPARLRKLPGADFQRRIAALAQFRDPLRLDVEPGDRERLGELHRKWQPDIAQPTPSDAPAPSDADPAAPQGGNPPQPQPAQPAPAPGTLVPQSARGVTAPLTPGGQFRY